MAATRDNVGGGQLCSNLCRPRWLKHRFPFRCVFGDRCQRGRPFYLHCKAKALTYLKYKRERAVGADRLRYPNNYPFAVVHACIRSNNLHGARMDRRFFVPISDPMKIHHFHAEDAERYGVPAAMLLYDILDETEYNKATREHQHDGRTWVRCSRRTLAKRYPFLTEKKIRHALNKLVAGGVLVTGHYGEHAMDRTLYYAPANH